MLWEMCVSIDVSNVALCAFLCLLCHCVVNYKCDLNGCLSNIIFVKFISPIPLNQTQGN